MKLNSNFKGQSVLTTVILLSISYLFSGCKENTILPPDLVPAVDNINTFESDTFSVVTHNILQDSLLTGGVYSGIRVSNATNFYHALGTIKNNSDFGFTHASFHVEVVPPTSSFTYKGVEPIFDSIVLAIPYITTFGDSISGDTQDLLVYRSLKRFPRDSAQFELTKDTFSYPYPIASKTINYNTFRKDSLNKFLRFKLASWVADSLKNQMDSLTVGGATSSYTKFLDWWNGFYVTCISASGHTLGYFNTYGTRMYVHYTYKKTDTSSLRDTTTDIFAFDPNVCNRFNTIERRYNGSLANQYLNTNQVKGDSMLFPQNIPGIAVQIKFPYLPNFGNYIINRAVLTLNTSKPVNDLIDTSAYGLIPRMQVFRVDGETDKVIKEYSTFGSGFVDARRYEVTIMGYKFIQYKIFITETVQNLISKQDTSFKLKVMGLSDSYPGAYGTVLKGSGSLVDSLKPKLSMIYTKIK